MDDDSPPDNAADSDAPASRADTCGRRSGRSAGFVNVPRIKGSHNAVLSGIMGAEHLSAAMEAGRANDTLVSYEDD